MSMARKRVTRLAMSLAVMSFAALAAPDAGSARSRGSVAAGEGQVRQLLTLMDTDRNGQVSREEFMGFMEGEFESLDVDRSGELNVEELSRARVRVSGQAQVIQLLRLMDKDRNGQVSKAEFMGFMQAEFNRLDVDRSGELTPGELSRTNLRVSPSHSNPHK